MKRYLFLFCLFSLMGFSFAQEKKFSSFELLYDLSQQMAETDNWPKYGIDDLVFNNDTLYTLRLKKNHIAMIPLSKSNSGISFIKTVFPSKYIPICFTKEHGRWYFMTNKGGLGYFNESGQFVDLVTSATDFFEVVFFIDNRILLYNRYIQQFALYDLSGKRVYTSPWGDYVFMYPYLYQNKILDGFSEITVENDVIHVSEIYDRANYGTEDVFIGGYKNFGYFVNWDGRNILTIRDLTDKSTKDSFKIPVAFSTDDSGLPEEDLINLRVFSQDNETFYFVALKHGHLKIYKAVR